MKESIGGISIFAIVVIMVIAFASIMSFTINHSNAFNVKDHIVTAIEESGGILENDLDDQTKKVTEDIAATLDKYSYRSTGNCEGLFPENDINFYCIRSADSINCGESYKEKANFCIAKVDTKAGTLKSYYYQVVVFYSLDIPIVRNFMTFKLMGETKILYK